ncbi:MAG TPA: FlgD immunoglobulin-like domain containing protein [Candidatus Limnocylindrales bacterium]
MRKSGLALALILIASLGLAVPSASAVSPGAKVVIIVGATEGTTASYRRDADAAYATAIQYTPNVVKVYSPNATWARVKAAVVGASVVIYLGHGNGWPSPYPYDPQFRTKDGFGLNAVEGAGDYNRVYYGEPYIATLQLAGAVVILNHLCYAAGSSEPGYPEPTVDVARQRVDNYASAFLKAGAAAVIAEARMGLDGYIRDLFTTTQPLESLWANQAGANGNVASFPSVRTPGATAFMDPQTPTSGFYRSLVVRAAGALNSGLVGGTAGGTSVDPPSLAIPGNASVAVDAADLFPDPGLGSAPVRTLAAGTRLRLVGEPAAVSAQATPLVQVQGLDDPSISGFVDPANLAPRDGTPPSLTSFDLGTGAISPNGDGVADQAVLSGQFSEVADWSVTISNAAGNVFLQQLGSGQAFQVVWNPLASGQSVADGSYEVTVSAVDAWQNRGTDVRRAILVDNSPAQLVALAPAATTVSAFSPNGDGYRDTVALTATTGEPGSLAVGVRDGSGTTLRTWSVPTTGAPTSLAWDGRDASGNVVADGRYVVSVTPIDAGGNAGGAQERTVRLASGLGWVATSVPVFYPQDRDALAPTTTLSFTLTRPMTVTWTLRDAAARVIDTYLAAIPLPAGSQTWVFDGRRSDGTMLPPGRYLSYVTASDGTGAVAQSVAFEADAFLVKPRDTTPARGQTITIDVTSAEPLSANPRLSIYQPGVTAWGASLKRVSGSTYRATIRLRTGGGTGPVSFKVTGVDVTGANQRTTRVYPLH